MEDGSGSGPCLELEEGTTVAVRVNDPRQGGGAEGRSRDSAPQNVWELAKPQVTGFKWDRKERG